MKVYVNDRNEIKDVHSTTDSSLLEVVINDEGNPFKDWSIAKICCYRVDVREGVVCMYTPYVNTLIIEQLDKLSTRDEHIEADVTTTQLGLAESYETTMAVEADLTNTQMGLVENYTMSLMTAEEVTDCQLALVELYDLITGGM